MYLREAARAARRGAARLAECVFIDTINDIAVLGAPDGEEFAEQVEAYEVLTEASPGLALAALPVARESERRVWVPSLDGRLIVNARGPESRAWFLSLDDRWFPCAAFYNGQVLVTRNEAEPVVGGMSGSPVITDDGAAVALVSTTGGDQTACPGIIDNLPGWLLDAMLGYANPRRRTRQRR
jgi:hypothetical protein